MINKFLIIFMTCACLYAPKIPVEYEGIERSIGMIKVVDLDNIEIRAASLDKTAKNLKPEDKTISDALWSKVTEFADNRMYLEPNITWGKILHQSQLCYTFSHDLIKSVSPACFIRIKGFGEAKQILVELRPCPFGPLTSYDSIEEKEKNDRQYTQYCEVTKAYIELHNTLIRNVFTEKCKTDLEQLKTAMDPHVAGIKAITEVEVASMEDYRKEYHQKNLDDIKKAENAYKAIDDILQKADRSIEEIYECIYQLHIMHTVLDWFMSDYIKPLLD